MILERLACELLVCKWLSRRDVFEQGVKHLFLLFASIVAPAKFVEVGFKVVAGEFMEAPDEPPLQETKGPLYGSGFPYGAVIPPDLCTAFEELKRL